MKKIIAIILLVALMVTTLSSCSTAELGLYNAIKSMKDLENYSFSGTQKFDFKEALLPKDTTFDLDTVDQDNLRMLSGEIGYTGSIDKPNHKIVLDLLFTVRSFNISLGYKKIAPIPLHIAIDNSNDKSFVEITPLIDSDFLDENDIPYETTEEGYYVFDILAIIDQINNLEQSRTTEMVNPYQAGTAEYTKYEASYNAGYNDGHFIYGYGYNMPENADTTAYEAGYYDGIDDYDYEYNVRMLQTVAVPVLESIANLTKPTQDQIDIENKFTKFMDELLNNFFSDLTMDNITQDGNKYSLDTTASDFYKTFLSIVYYICDNQDDFKTVLLNFVNDLTEEQVLQITTGSIEKDMLIDTITNIELPSSDELALDEVQDQIDYIQDSYNPTAGFTFERTGDESYEMTNYLNMEGYLDSDYYLDSSIMTTDTSSDVSTAEEEYCIYTYLDITGDTIVYGNEITVTPDTVTVKAGKTQAFTASQNVEWSVSGNQSQDTVISADGDLSVALNETSENLVVTATSAYDDSITASSAVTVTLAPKNAATPAFTKDLSGEKIYTKGDTADELKVTAAAADDGSVTYQWYKSSTNTTAGTAIAGATTDTFKPSTSETGVSYYYVIATNTNNNVTTEKTVSSTSGICKVVVNNVEVNVPPATGNLTNGNIQGDTEDIKDAILTDDDEQKLANGSDISIYLKVEKAEVPQADQEAIQSALGENTLAQYLDISLIKNIDGVEANVTETNKPVRITIDVPENLRGSGKTFVVVHVHNGVTTTLPDLDTNPDTITIETDSFSTYAIAYKDSPTPVTSDSSNVLSLALLGMGSLLLAVAVFKKKKYFITSRG